MTKHLRIAGGAAAVAMFLLLPALSYALTGGAFTPTTGDLTTIQAALSWTDGGLYYLDLVDPNGVSYAIATSSGTWRTTDGFTIGVGSDADMQSITQPVVWSVCGTWHLHFFSDSLFVTEVGNPAPFANTHGCPVAPTYVMASSTQIVVDPDQDLFDAALLFLASMVIMIWLMRAK